MMGMSWVSGLAFKAAATSNPSSSGIMQSSKIKSGRLAPAKSSASRPSWATLTSICISVSMSAIIWAMSASC
jgi:hypothetical protein